MQKEAVCLVSGSVYMRQACWHRSGAGLHETKPIASFEGWVTRDMAPGIVCGLVYAKHSRLLRSGVGLYEMKPLASFESWVT